MSVVLVTVGLVFALLGATGLPFLFVGGLAMCFIGLTGVGRSARRDALTKVFRKSQHERVCSNAHCQYVNEPYAKFCERCGQALT